MNVALAALAIAGFSKENAHAFKLLRQA